MTFELPPLPYPKDALAPHVSAETLELHHGKHHAAYVAKLNELVKGSPFEGRPLDDIVREAQGPLFNNGAQHWNHSFYWHCLSPRGGGKPKGHLGDALASTFGSFDEFEKSFTKTAVETFGSGWAWLVEKDGQLQVVSTKDADNPLRTGARPLLTCDVWEHAYYVDYRNARPKYVEAFWKLVDWDFVAKNMGEDWAIERAAADRLSPS
jgi:Fe-Mn family superoxide dismutase